MDGDTIYSGRNIFCKLMRGHLQQIKSKNWVKIAPAGAIAARMRPLRDNVDAIKSIPISLYAEVNGLINSSTTQVVQSAPVCDNILKKHGF